MADGRWLYKKTTMKYNIYICISMNFNNTKIFNIVFKLYYLTKFKNISLNIYMHSQFFRLIVGNC